MANVTIGELTPASLVYSTDLLVTYNPSSSVTASSSIEDTIHTVISEEDISSISSLNNTVLGPVDPETGERGGGLQDSVSTLTNSVSTLSSSVSTLSGSFDSLITHQFDSIKTSNFDFVIDASNGNILARKNIEGTMTNIYNFGSMATETTSIGRILPVMVKSFPAATITANGNVDTALSSTEFAVLAVKAPNESNRILTPFASNNKWWVEVRTANNTTHPIVSSSTIDLKILYGKASRINYWN